MRLGPPISCLLVVSGAMLPACWAFGSAQAAPLSDQNFIAMASRCAPGIVPQTLRAVALTESGLDPWALHDNTAGISEKPETFGAALVDARKWVGEGHSVDIGLMQVNSANLSALNMTVQTALDPCTSMAGGAAVLRAAYGGGDTPADQQVALLMALSRYNTGSPLRGIMNGYARTVMAQAGWEIPPPAVSLQSPLGTLAALTPNPNAPPAWNVGAVGAYAQSHGAPWLVSMPLGPAARQTARGPLSPAPAVPLVLAANASQSAAGQPAALTQPKPRNPQ